MATQFKLRRDTAANWTTANPTLAQGEPGFETDTNKLKIGDGLTAWATLPYLVPGATTYTADRVLVSDASGVITASATITATELGYLDGVSSAIQTQLDAKAPATQTIDDKSAAYSIVASDAGKLIRSTGSAITITIADVLQNGQRVDFIQAGSGQITFSPSSVTLNSVDTKRKTNKQYSGATLYKAGGVYYLIGDLAA